MHFTIAHFSDSHLGPLPSGAALRNFKLKRIIGACSWHFRRKQLHLPGIANAVRDSIIASKPDHIAFTGDAVNLAAWAEFPRAASWLEGFGKGSDVTFVPGNHDAYVDVPWGKGLQAFQPWMQDTSERIEGPSAFPFVRLRRNIAIIGLNSACPQSLRKAGGTLGGQQLRDLEHHLERLARQGFCRVVLIHHPPLPGLAKQRKALTDAAALEETLRKNGCELVLHGHNHRFMANKVETVSGTAHVIGVPSASIRPKGNHEAAGWNQFRIRRQSGIWQIELTRHIWNNDRQRIEAAAPALLSPA